MTKTRVARSLAALFLWTLTIPLLADTLQVGGPLRWGEARPPLHINLNPSFSAYYTPAQIRHAYGFDQLTATGANQKLGIVVAYGNSQIQSNLNAFCTRFGISSATIQILGNNSGRDAGWALETALDVEWSHAIAPGAGIILSVAASNGINDLLAAIDAAVNAGATVISMSWGGPEFPGMTFYDSHFNRTNVTFVASSGDNGAGVEWPAASALVIGVGGTTLQLDASGNRLSETAWSGSGGGVSQYNLEPAFQTGWQSSGGRGSPDVSYVADPATGVLVYDLANGGWFVVGGTSAGAPQWAGSIALANELRAKNGYGRLTSPNNLLYGWAQLGTTPPFAVNPAYFFDVSSGSNGGYNAGLKYDFVTGLGSPVASTLVPALAPPAVVQSADFSLAAKAVTGSVKAGSPASYALTITASGGFNDVVKLSVSGLPAGAIPTFKPASVTGAGSSVLWVSTTTNATKGTFTLTITGASSGASGVHTHSVPVTLQIK